MLLTMIQPWWQLVLSEETRKVVDTRTCSAQCTWVLLALSVFYFISLPCQELLQRWNPACFWILPTRKISRSPSWFILSLLYKHVWLNDWIWMGLWRFDFMFNCILLITILLSLNSDCLFFFVMMKIDFCTTLITCSHLLSNHVIVALYTTLKVPSLCAFW